MPFTFIVIMPTNHKLLSPERDLSSLETRNLLEQWGRLHAVRSVLSLLSSVVYLVMLTQAYQKDRKDLRPLDLLT